MSAVRSFLAFVILLMAVASAVAGVGARWVDAVARTQEPAEMIVAPLATDRSVRSAIASELETAAKREIPEAVDQIPNLRATLEALLATAVDNALEDPGVENAWKQTITASRVALVEDLDAYRSDAAETPTIWLDLSPFVTLGREKLLAAADETVRPYLEQVAWDKDVRVALGRPDATVTKLASETIAMAQHWKWMFVATALLGVLGLLIGSRRGRWVASILAALLGLGGVVLGRFALGRFRMPRADSVEGAVTGRLADGAVASLLEWTAQVPWWLLGVVGVSVVALSVAAMTKRPPAPEPDPG